MLAHDELSFELPIPKYVQTIQHIPLHGLKPRIKNKEKEYAGDVFTGYL